MKIEVIAAAAMAEAVARTGKAQPSDAELNIALLTLVVEARMTGFDRAAPNPRQLPVKPRPPEGL